MTTSESTAGDSAALLRRMRRRIAAQQAPSDAAVVATASRLRHAAAATEIGAALPSLAHLSPLRRAVATAVGRVVLYFLRLITTDQSRFNRLIVGAMQEGESGAAADTAALRAAVEQGRTDLRAAVAANAAALAEQRQVLSARVAEQGQMLSARIDASATHLDAVATRLDAVAARLEVVAARQRDGATARGEQIASLQRGLDEVRVAHAWLRQQADAARRRNAAPPAAAQATPAIPGAAPPQPALDSWMFAETFRGDEPALRARQRRYLPLFADCVDVLDVGCGRGEFLELLREAGIAARGVDVEPDMAQWCNEKGLDVICGDALETLAALPEGSLGGVFCAQVVEHLATADMLRLVALAARALRPNGVLVVETLNPESLLVLYRWFWADLTHHRLVHPETLRFIVEEAGLQTVEVRYVPPPEGPLRLPVLQLPDADPEQLARFNAATQYLNDLLYGSFDYAVVARR